MARLQTRPGPGDRGIREMRQEPQPAISAGAFSGVRLRALARGWPSVVLYDISAPALLTIVAGHELRYDRASISTWLLVLAIIWPLAVRRRAPVAVFVVCMSVGVVLWANHTFTVAEVSLLVALYSVAVYRDLRYSLPAAAAVEAGVVLLATRFGPTGSVDDAVLLLTGLAAAALLLGTTVRAQRRYLSSVEDRAERLECERAHETAPAAAAERTRIAREMHDIVAHGLAVVITLAEGAALTSPSDPQAAQVAMREVASAGRLSLAEMRRLLGVLRTEDPAEHGPTPTLAALDGLVTDIRRTGLTIRVDIGGEIDSVSDSLQATIYRVVQESLTNVLKHAVEATSVDIDIEINPVMITFQIIDNGRSVQPGGSGNGVTGMRERIAIFDGVLTVGPTTRGWQVRGEIPHR